MARPGRNPLPVFGRSQGQGQEAACASTVGSGDGTVKEAGRQAEKSAGKALVANGYVV